MTTLEQSTIAQLPSSSRRAPAAVPDAGRATVRRGGLAGWAGLMLAGAAGLLASGLPGCAASQTTTPDLTAPDARAATAGALAKRAEAAEARGDLDEALNLYGQAVQLVPSFAAAWNQIGIIHLKRNDGARAEAAFRQAIENDPRDPRYPFNLGWLWEERSYLDDAAQWYDLALERDPRFLPALRQSVRVDHMRARDNERTAERIRTALLLETDPKWREYLQRRREVVEEQVRQTRPVTR
jgi:tetratricopeptide (TPR) repeat protein